MPLTMTIEGLDTSVLPAFTTLQLDLENAGAKASQAGAKAGAAYAKQNHKFKNRSGTLEASIGWKKLVDRGTNPASEFFATAEWALFVDEGTKAHPIDPKPGNATGMMWWNDPHPDGPLVHATHVNHPGTWGNSQPDRFMARASGAAEVVTEQVLEVEVAAACARADR